MTAATPAPPRLLALDVFRGATVALMILVNNPGSWAHLYPPLAHAAWHGVTPTDLVFPFFLFAVGNAMAIALPQWAAAGPRTCWGRIARRTALIFAIGLLLNASPFVRWGAEGELVWRSWETLRFMGVLQRIALCFGAAAVIVWALQRREAAGHGRAAPAVLAVSAVLLLGSWAAMLAFGDRTEPYGLEGFWGTPLDRALLGAAHLYRGEGVPFDPEGLASTVPAVVNVLLGWWAGQVLLARRPGVPRGVGAADAAPRLVALFAAGTLLLALAWAWALVLPFNKKIWTPSYVLLSSGYALLALAVLLHLLRERAPGAQQGADAVSRTGWAALAAQAGAAVAHVSACFGRNALFVFVLSGLVPRVLALLRWPDGTAADGMPRWISPLPWLWRTVFEPLAADPRLGSLAFAAAQLALYAALAWGLDRRRIYIRV
jgi:predicted acyltransferase